MSKAFPVAKDVFIKNATTGVDHQFRLKPPPTGKFAKTPKVACYLDGNAVSFPQTSSKGWTAPGATLYYLWLELADGRTGWVTSELETPFVDGMEFTVAEGQATRTDPKRALLDGADSPEVRRLAGFKAAWAAKQAANPEPVATEGEKPKKAKKSKVEA